MTARLRLIVTVSLAVLLCAGVTATASAHPRLTLRRHFTAIAGNRLLASQRYTFVSSESDVGVYTGGELIDNATGTRRALSTHGCEPSALGAQWLALTCGPIATPTFELYDIDTGQTQPFTSTLRYQDCSSDCDPISAIGADWIAFLVLPGDEHDLPTFAFQNIQTGQVFNGSADATTTLDLDSPTLAEPACAPLQVPSVSDAYSSGWGSLTAVGRFELAAGGGAYLERCGSAHRRRLTFTIPTVETPGPYGCDALACAPAHDRNTVIWESAPGRLRGIFLPSERTFTIPLPARVDPAAGSGEPANDDLYQLAITPRTLYLQTSSGHIWTTPAPRLVRATRHRRSRAASAR